MSDDLDWLNEERSDKSDSTQEKEKKLKNETSENKQRQSNSNSSQRRKITLEDKIIEFLKENRKNWIIAMNYAINTIKNKKEVKEKKESSTWYKYFKDWTEDREFLKELDKYFGKETTIIGLWEGV